jgi:ATP-dependent protease ClpP protease subunit
MLASPQPTQFPGGYFVGFNGAIDRKAAEQLVVQIKSAPSIGHSRVHLLMSCLGGSVEEAFYAANIMQALSDVHLVTYNIGTLGSAGNIIFLTGRERYFADGATIFFHLAHASLSGSLTNSMLRYQAKNFQLGDARISNFVSARTGVPLEKVKRWHTDERIMSAQEAQANGVMQGINVPSIPGDAYFYQITF